MYRPDAPDPHPSNAADYTADDLLSVMASHRTPREQAAILAGAFLEYARWLTDWSPPKFQEAQPQRKKRGLPKRGTDQWRRRERAKREAVLAHQQIRRRVPGW